MVSADVVWYKMLPDVLWYLPLNVRELKRSNFNQRKAFSVADDVLCEKSRALDD